MSEISDGFGSGGYIMSPAEANDETTLRITVLSWLAVLILHFVIL